MFGLSNMTIVETFLCTQIAFVVKDKFTNLIWRSQFAQFYYFVENIAKFKSTDFKIPRTDSS